MKVGESDIIDLSLGSTPINRVYQGSNLVWERQAEAVPALLEFDTTKEGLFSMSYSNFVGDIDWGDGTVETITASTASKTHTYAPGSGTKRVRLIGDEVPGSQLTLTDCGITGTLDLSKLTSSTGIWDFLNNPAMTTVVFPVNPHPRTRLSLSGNSGLTGTLDLSGLTGGFSSLVLTNCSGLTGLITPNAPNSLCAYNLSGANGLTGDIAINTKVASFNAGAATTSVTRWLFNVPQTQGVGAFTAYASQGFDFTNFTNGFGNNAAIDLSGNGTVVFSQNISTAACGHVYINATGFTSVDMGGQRILAGRYLDLYSSTSLSSFSINSTDNRVPRVYASNTALDQVFGFGTKLFPTWIWLTSGTGYSTANADQNIADIYNSRANANWATTAKEFDIKATVTGPKQAPEGFELGVSDGNAVTAGEMVYVLEQHYNWEFTVTAYSNPPAEIPTGAVAVMEPVVDVSATSVYWLQGYKSSDWPEITTTKAYFFLWSTDHDTGSGGIWWGEADDAQLTGFVERGLVHTGYQAETPWLLRVGSAIHLYYHTTTNDPLNVSGVQETHLRTTAGGVMHEAIWTYAGKPLGYVSGEQHLGYARFWHRPGSGDIVAAHVTHGNPSSRSHYSAGDGTTFTRTEELFYDTAMPPDHLFSIIMTGTHFTYGGQGYMLGYLSPPGYPTSRRRMVLATVDSNYKVTGLVKTVYDNIDLESMTGLVEGDTLHLWFKANVKLNPIYHIALDIPALVA